MAAMRGTGLLGGCGAPLTATHYDGTCARTEVRRALPALGGLSGSRHRMLPCGELIGAGELPHVVPVSVERCCGLRRLLEGGLRLAVQDRYSSQPQSLPPSAHVPFRLGAICGARRRWKNRA